MFAVAKSSKDVQKQGEPRHKRISSKHYFRGRVTLRTPAAYIQFTKLASAKMRCLRLRVSVRACEGMTCTRVHHGSAFSASIGQIEARREFGRLQGISRVLRLAATLHTFIHFAKINTKQSEVLGVMSPKCTLARREMAHLSPQTWSFCQGPISLHGNRWVIERKNSSTIEGFTSSGYRDDARLQNWKERQDEFLLLGESNCFGTFSKYCIQSTNLLYKQRGNKFWVITLFCILPYIQTRHIYFMSKGARKKSKYFFSFMLQI